MSGKRTRAKRFGLVALGMLACVGGGVFLTTLAAPLDPPPPFDGALPAASPPPSMRVFALPTGITRRSAGFAYRGGSFVDARDFAMTAVLVTHPAGDLIIDTGFGRRVAQHFAAMPFWFRLATPYERHRSAAEQLDAAGYDRRRLRGILLTHAHWDHVSGVPDFPGVPVLATRAERGFIARGGPIMAVARGLGEVRWESYGFEGGPYLGFPKSHDVHGDGSIVVVRAPGHTPGSVVVFLALPDGRRYAMVGDLVWQREGITEREERPWLQRRSADLDAALLRTSLLRMSAIATRFPEMVLVPAHDARGFAEMPTFSRRALETSLGPER